MSESQRAVAVAEVNAWSPAGNPAQRGNVATLTNAQMAEEAKVSPRTIRSAKTAVEGGLGDHIKRGETTVHAAAQLARKDPELAREVAEGRAPMPKPEKRQLPTPPPKDFTADFARMESQMMDMRAELIELRAASHDPQLRAQAHDEISGLREALELEQTLHAALKSQVETQEYQLNDWKTRCASLERKIQRMERGA
jgi:hypothetical protein